jgi:phospholipase C
MKHTARSLLLLASLSTTLTYAQTTFQHIIVIVQENRTPDNLFQGLCASPYGTCPRPYNISPNGVVPTNGQPIALTSDPLYDDLDPDHSNASFVSMYNSGGIDQGPTHVSCTNSPYCCTKFGHKNASSCMENGVEVYNWMHYVTNDAFKFNGGPPAQRLAPYLTLATQYGWANYFFQTNQGPSMPAHQFLLSGTSAPTAPPNALFDAENPGNDIYDSNTGCTAPAGVTVALIDANGKENTNQPIYPCFEHATLTDLLDNAGLTWKYYANTTGSIWTAPNAIEHICLPTSPVDGTCGGQDWVNDVLPYIGTGKVLTDLGVNGTSNSACQLPAVSWVIPDGNWSDHAGLMSNGNAFGPAWVGDIVDAVGGTDNTGAKLPIQCNYWQNTAILITWDDWGGWYDHVEPFKILLNTQNNPCDVWGCGYVYGFRAPFMFVSAYTPQGFVSGTVNLQNTTNCTDPQHCYDFGSILQFIELNFGLRNISGQNNQYADVFAKALDPAFYGGQFRQFQAIPTPVPPNCFINPNAANCIPNYTGPVDPDDDGTEPSN